MFKSIKVGVYDWTNFPVQNGFYPEDLPVDWKLSFYANEFETACINIDETLDISLLVEWLEDLTDNFQLSFNLIAFDKMDQLAKELARYNSNIKYLFVPDEKRDMLQRNESARQVLSSFETDTASSQQIISLSSIWTPDNKVKSASVALLPDIDNIRLYRNWIELWMEANSQQELTLWLDAETARYANVSELRTLVELMGY